MRIFHSGEATDRARDHFSAMRALPLAILCLSLCGCGAGDSPTVIDGSSQAAFEETLAAAKREVGAADRLKLEAAIAEHRTRMFAKADDRREFQRLVREGMDGLTAPGIVAQFDRDVDRVGGKAADTIFDAKRALQGR